MAMNPLSEQKNHVIIVPPMKSKGGAIVGRPSKYDSMSKEELLAAMRERQKKNASYQWKKTCTLTLQEGETLENDFLAKFECDNVSQLLKKIVHGELIVSSAESDS